MASKRKYCPGEVISSLDELATQEFIYIHDKIYHRGWWQSLQFSFVKRKMDAGCIQKAERVAEDATKSRKTVVATDAKTLADSMKNRRTNL